MPDPAAIADQQAADREVAHLRQHLDQIPAVGNAKRRAPHGRADQADNEAVAEVERAPHGRAVARREDCEAHAIGDDRRVDALLRQQLAMERAADDDVIGRAQGEALERGGRKQPERPAHAARSRERGDRVSCVNDERRRSSQGAPRAGEDASDAHVEDVHDVGCRLAQPAHEAEIPAAPRPRRQAVVACHRPLRREAKALARSAMALPSAPFTTKATSAGPALRDDLLVERHRLARDAVP